MTTIKTIVQTPMGYQIQETGQMCDKDGNVLARTVADTVPEPAPVIINTVTDPSAADRDQARTDAEAARFTELKRLFVVCNGIALAHQYWEQRTRLEEWEQQELADDRRKLERCTIGGVALVDMLAVSIEDAKLIAASFPHRRVYFGGAEVKL